MKDKTPEEDQGYTTLSTRAEDEHEKWFLLILKADKYQKIRIPLKFITSYSVCDYWKKNKRNELKLKRMTKTGFRHFQLQRWPVSALNIRPLFHEIVLIKTWLIIGYWINSIFHYCEILCCISIWYCWTFSDSSLIRIWKTILDLIILCHIPRNF